LQLGAQGVSLGTRFLASDEAHVHPGYRRRVIEASAADTVLLDDLFDVGWPDAPHRVLRNKTVAEWEAAGRPRSGQRPGEGTSIGKRLSGYGRLVDWPRYGSGVAGPEFDGDIEYAPLWAGESCSVVNDIKPAGQIVRDLVRDAERSLAESPVSGLGGASGESGAGRRPANTQAPSSRIR
jgi:NAD(P)H-dependent flavin oxidoreductase YrpB (nitropropane dioxygenase family)